MPTPTVHASDTHVLTSSMLDRFTALLLDSTLSTNTQMPVSGMVMPSVRVTRLAFPFDGEEARLLVCREAAGRTCVL